MTPIPNKFMEEARKIVYKADDNTPLDQFEQEYQVELIAQALTTAEERGRKAGLEEGAKVAYDYPMNTMTPARIAKAIRSLSKPEARN